MQKTLCSLFPIHCQFPKLDVAGSIPVSRSMSFQSFTAQPCISSADFGLNSSPYRNEKECFECKALRPPNIKDLNASRISAVTRAHYSILSGLKAGSYHRVFLTKGNNLGLVTR
jgi:hypothetical protein